VTPDAARTSGPPGQGATPAHPAVAAARNVAAAAEALHAAGGRTATPGSPLAQGEPRLMTAAEQYQVAGAITAALGDISDFLIDMEAEAVPGGPNTVRLGQAARSARLASVGLIASRALGNAETQVITREAGSTADLNDAGHETLHSPAEGQRGRLDGSNRSPTEMSSPAMHPMPDFPHAPTASTSAGLARLTASGTATPPAARTATQASRLFRGR
jgi:hypothetical protein